MSCWSGVECGAVLWVAGLCVVCAAGALVRALPVDGEGAAAGAAAGIAFGMLPALASHMVATCSAW